MPEMGWVSASALWGDRSILASNRGTPLWGQLRLHGPIWQNRALKNSPLLGCAV
ncbi:hypothetical protein O77CONTIG1_02910 [Leptolyngbya sp. O-77]|nr:hypothetical protein O77CONTIG1_02910 [Leptolyngbya sp. O-77]